MTEKSRRCFVCENPLDQTNVSDEHILLNSAGGRLRSRRIICKGCNGVFGRNADAELSRQLNHVSNILLIKRDRGKAAPTTAISTVSGMKYQINSDGRPSLIRPVIEEIRTETQVNLSIQARNRAELKKIIDGYRRKYPTVDFDPILESAEYKELYIPEKLHHSLSIGGPLANQSIAKTAVEFYLHKNLLPGFISSAIVLLKNGTGNTLVECINPEHLPYQQGEFDIRHAIYIRGNPVSKTLYAYVEYFSIFSFIVKLNTDYSGPQVSVDYSFDVLTRQVVDGDLKEVLPIDEVKSFRFSETPNLEKMKEHMATVLITAHRRQEREYISTVVDSAFLEVMGRDFGSREGTSDEFGKILEIVNSKMIKYAIRRIKTD